MLKAFMVIHGVASIKSISAHMHSPLEVIRNIWTKFPHIHQACWNTIESKSCFSMPDLTWAGLLPLCWHKFTSTIERRGDQMWLRLVIHYPASLMTCVTWHYNHEWGTALISFFRPTRAGPPTGCSCMSFLQNPRWCCHFTACLCF